MTGSGTVAVEAAAAGKDGLFSDVDPLSCLITRAKSHPVDPEWLKGTVEQINEKARPFSKRGAKPAEALASIKDLEGSTRFRAPPDVLHWFQPYVAVNLSRAFQILADLNLSGEKADAILACMAAVIRRVSRADPATTSGLEVTKVRSRKLGHGLRFDVFAELGRKTKVLSEGYRELLALPSLGTTRVVERDVKQWSDLCAETKLWPDLVVTSPCYISAIEYWRRHKLEYSWLGMVDPETLSRMRGRFLGMGTDEPDLSSLPAYVRELHQTLLKHGEKAHAVVLARYFADSAVWLGQVEKVIRRTGGTAYVVVAGNTNHGLTIDTPRALLEIAAQSGLTVSRFMEYGIKNSYMQYRTKTERIKVETILKLVVK
jgi:site-specific DNA-methyltransferase (cytosine-N4-specific)